MKVCPNCRQQFPDNVMFCPNDGGTLSEQQSEDTLIGRLLEGKYRIEKELGRLEYDPATGVYRPQNKG